MQKACLYAECMKNYDQYRTFNLLTRLGPTLLGFKPMHVFCFNEHFPFLNEVLHDLDHLFSNQKNIRTRIVFSKNKSIKAIVYHIDAAQKILQDPRNIKFLEKQGYPATTSLEGYMDILAEDLMENQLRDEFGLFFGYPLKDVVGFIGHPALKHVKTRGWKIYGNPKLSDETFQRFQKAEQTMLSLIQEKTKEEIDFEIFSLVSAS